MPADPGLRSRPRLPDAVNVTPAEQLCLACGLCCDGTLFHHVQLGAEDDAQGLKALGLPVSVSRAKKPITFFRQPCTALCGDRTCHVYADRPKQCRDYECGVFKAVGAGRMELPAALRLVKQVRERADAIRRMLGDLGDDDGHRSLNERFRRTKRRMEAGGMSAEALDLFAELSQAMHHLSLQTQEKFYLAADAS